MATKKATENVIGEATMDLNLEIPQIETRTFSIKLIGDSSLISNKWSEKAMRMILDKQTKKAANGMAAKDPWMDFCDSLYWLSTKPDKPTEEDVMNAR